MYTVILQNLLRQEYLEPCTSKHPDVPNRQVVVSTILDIVNSFLLRKETFFTAIRLFDLYAATAVRLVPRPRLYGCTSCFIAAKLHEKKSLNVKDLAKFITFHAKCEEIITMELTMCETLNWNLAVHTSFEFISYYFVLLEHMSGTKGFQTERNEAYRLAMNVYFQISTFVEKQSHVALRCVELALNSRATTESLVLFLDDYLSRFEK